MLCRCIASVNGLFLCDKISKWIYWGDIIILGHYY